MSENIEIINQKVKDKHSFIDTMFTEMNKVIVGQQYLLERLLIGILSNGHVLIEGVPGLAKTLSVKTLADVIGARFQRIQFTPDLLPADLVGTLIYNPKNSTFETKKGPIFSNIILADEINRAPSKVQSALLEAMQERQVTIGENTFKLDDPFLVLATQNPIEQGGTYPLPEAQIDRFMLKLQIKYPSKIEEKNILDRMSALQKPVAQSVISVEEIIAVRNLVSEIYIDDKIKDYILDIVFATREPTNYKLNELQPLILYGASPRATISLTVASRAHAFLRGRGYVIPDDVKQIGHDILRHRIMVTYEAEAEDLTSDDIIKMLFDKIDVP
jgi:MoxR-like ATPase